MVFPEEKGPYVKPGSYTYLWFLTGGCNRPVHCPVPPVTPLNSFLAFWALGRGQVWQLIAANSSFMGKCVLKRSTHALVHGKLLS